MRILWDPKPNTLLYDVAKNTRTYGGHWSLLYMNRMRIYFEQSTFSVNATLSIYLIQKPRDMINLWEKIVFFYATCKGKLFYKTIVFGSAIPHTMGRTGIRSRGSQLAVCCTPTLPISRVIRLTHVPKRTGFSHTDVNNTFIHDNRNE